MKRKTASGITLGACKAFVVVLVLLLSLSPFLVFQAKASSENTEMATNPATLYEIPGEMKVTFQVYLNNQFSLSSKPDFQLGETIYLSLSAEYYRWEPRSKIANNTIFVISNPDGTPVWNTSTCQFGAEGSFSSASTIIYWTPENTGNYAAGVILEETKLPNDFTKAIPFNVLAPAPFTGKVTELDGMTPIGNATLEAIQGDAIKANTTTDAEGRFTMEISRAGTYDVRVSASGYVTTVHKRLLTQLENAVLDFTLAPVDLSSTFNIAWTKALVGISDFVVDSYGNIIAAGGMGTTVVSKFYGSGNALWKVNRSLSGKFEIPRGLAVDSFGNILMLLDTGGAEYDFCVVKLDASGNDVWKSVFDSGENDFGSAIAVDSQDNVIVVGNSFGINHGDGALVVVRYDSSGNLVWSKELSCFLRISDIISDQEDNVVLCGSTTSNLNLTDEDYYVAKIDIGGSVLWEQTFSSAGENPDCGCGVALDSGGNIVVVGDRFMLKLDQNGTKVWLRYFTGKDVFVDANGNILSIGGSSVEVFGPRGFFLGETSFMDELCDIALVSEDSVVVVGENSLNRLSYEITTTNLLDGSAQADTGLLEESFAGVPLTAGVSVVAATSCVGVVLHFKKSKREVERC